MRYRGIAVLAVLQYVGFAGQPATVRVHGTCVPKGFGSLVLTGPEDSFVTWIGDGDGDAGDGEAASISGGARLQLKSFTGITDPMLLAELPTDTARAAVKQVVRFSNYVLVGFIVY